MSNPSEDIITKTLVELPGTRYWVPGSSRRIAHMILKDLKAQGAVISFPVKPSIVVPSETDMAMRRLVKMDRRDQ